MCLIGVKETYVQEKKKVTKNFLGQICTTVSGLKPDPFRALVKVFRYAQHAYNVDMCFSGFNISQRRRRKSIIGFQHRITKEESIKWFQSKVTDVDCFPGTETYTPLMHCPFLVHFVFLISLVSWVLGRWWGEKGADL